VFALRCYISSLDLSSLSTGSYTVTGAWKNSLHGVLDMTFRKDTWCKRAGHSAQDFAHLWKFALNILKRDKGKGSIVTKRLKVGWNINYIFFLIPISLVFPNRC